MSCLFLLLNINLKNLNDVELAANEDSSHDVVGVIFGLQEHFKFCFLDSIKLSFLFWSYLNEYRYEYKGE